MFVFLFWKLKKHVHLPFMIHCKLLFLSVFFRLFLPFSPFALCFPFLFIFFSLLIFPLFHFFFPYFFFLLLFLLEFLPHFLERWIFSLPKKQGICKNVYPCTWLPDNFKLKENLVGTVKLICLLFSNIYAKTRNKKRKTYNATKHKVLQKTKPNIIITEHQVNTYQCT